MQKTKVLHISGSSELGGNEVHILTLFKFLDKEKFDLSLALPGHGRFWEKAIQMNYFKAIPLRKDLLANRDSVKELRRIIEELKPEIVHTHNRREDYSGGRAARFEKVKVVITTIHDRINMNQQGFRVRNLKSFLYKRILADYFDYLIAVSEVTRNDLLDQLSINQRKIVHITNGVDLSQLDVKIDREEKRKELGFVKKDKLIGLVARLKGKKKNKKGHFLLIESFPEVIKEIPQAKMVIIGNDREAEDYLRSLAEKKGVGDKLYCLGFRDDIYEVISVLDLKVLPSFFEGLPRALMEAMGLGIPVIGSRVDGIKELLGDGRYGLQISIGKSEELAEAIITLLQDQFLYKTIKKEGKSRIFENYGAEKMAQETEELYLKSLSE